MADVTLGTTALGWNVAIRADEAHVAASLAVARALGPCVTHAMDAHTGWEWNCLRKKLK